jgi:hypothetical protein
VPPATGGAKGWIKTGQVRSRGAVLVVSGLLLCVAFASSVSALAPSITKPDFVVKANAICAAGTAKLEAAAAKLGDSPTEKQAKAFAVAVFVPNVAGQIAKIRKLGFPAEDKAQLDAMFKEASKVLADIKRNPELALQSDPDAFADVNPKLRAYGLTECGSGSDPVIAAVEALVGHYQGTWTNTTFGSTGTIDMTIALDAATRTATVTSTLTGNVFGAPAPPPQSVQVPLDASDPLKPVTVTSPVFGSVTVAAQADGSIVIDAANLPSPNAATMHAVFKPTATGMDATYTVGLRSGATANGVITMKKV